jgi:hypothetical protein
VLLSAAWASNASATTVYVSGAAQFDRAVAALAVTGGRIVLLPHRYRHPLVVGPRSSGLLTILGERGARVQDLDLDSTRFVEVTHLTIAPLTQDATLLVYRSRDVVLDHLAFTAQGTSRKVDLDLEQSARVTVRESSFSHCGDGSLEWSLCLLPGYSSHVTIENNRFHDCLGCDFIHGRAGPEMLIRENRFARALACHFGTVKCRHQDLIELFAADGLVISRNRFGVSQDSGAQLYLTDAVDHVRISNNLFVRTDPRIPNVHSPVGVVVGVAISTRLPHDVEIINNTILSGIRTRKHRAVSILLSPRYRLLRRRNRPLVANNVLARLYVRHLVCLGARDSIRNDVEVGNTCSSSDSHGDPNLDAEYRPTSASTLLIARANAALAPPYDLIGRPRGRKPDIGCYEYVPR